MAVALFFLRRSTTWSPHWVSLGFGALVCAIVSAIVIITVDGSLPGGKDRRRLLIKVGSTMFPESPGLQRWFESLV